jgi:penicillin-binding protein 1A
MEQAERDDSVWSEVRTFADRHIRAVALVLGLLAVPMALLFLIPGILVATAAPLTAPVRLKATISVTYLDKDGKVIGRQGPVAGQYVRLNQVPAYLPAAFLAMEDRRFYAHHGVDLLGLSRAAYTDIRARRFVAGGSTISQQTAKLLFTDGSRTFRRKLHELANAARLEKSFSKDQILEIYLNRIYLGEGTFGVDSAARNYFGVPAQQLSLAQAAMLAGVTRAPTLYSPRRSLGLAQKRASMVLDQMVDTGAITQAQAQAAAARPAGIIPAHHDDHDYVLDAAAGEVQKLVTDNDIPARALFVHTTIDSSLQSQAQDTVSHTVARLGPKLGFSQAALVLMTPDGSILSLVGGVDYGRSVFDRATQAHRQPGSAFKAFVYLAALEQGISPWELRQDQPVDIAGWQPANYKNASYGQLRLVDALARSVNTISVNLAQEVGVAKVAAAARRLGIVSPLHDNASLALGTDEVTPLELTAAYGAFVNGGRRPSPHLVASLSDAYGTTLFQRQEREQALVVSDPVRRDMTAMLSRVLEAGTGTAARLPGREAAGKTGTTQDYRDAWFVGFTAGHVAGVWIGNDDNSPMRKVTGGTVPAQMWKAVMLAAEAHAPVIALDRSPAPPEIKPEQVTAPAYLDDPMQGSTFVEPAPYRMPEIAAAEPPPPVSASVSSSAPAPVPASIPAQPVAQPGATPVAQSAPGQAMTTPGLPPRETMRAPDQNYPQIIPAPAQAPSARPLRDAEAPPARAAPDAETLYRRREAEYRQRMEEYRRVLRQATSPGPEEDTPTRLRDKDEDVLAPPPSARETMPFPR